MSSLRTIALPFLLAMIGFGSAQAGENWANTGVIDAPEAVQAAAADGDFAYAIASTKIARYDRASGRKVAESIGEAQHLNSGIFHEGKLYCAHSNYPRTPEESEIKVLDPESMQLTAFHRFDKPEGSLTWAVYRDGTWWCNFARYGAKNVGTLLVRYDAAWKEQERWTYPPELFQHLGKYSLSGGIWRGETLLVTGHDDPLAFQLRLPKQGKVLEWIGKASVPFTGQGIAVDPATGGLVGIDRAKRQVVFASLARESKQRLRILTYNIHHGEGVDRKLDLERIAKVIASESPDLVALQEVDCKTKRTGGVDQPAELAKLLKMHVAFGAAIPLQGGEYGNAVLSRFQILHTENIKLPNIDDGEPRAVLEVEVKPHEDRPAVLFLATHFDYRTKDRERMESVKIINDWMKSEDKNQQAFLAGDLNDVPESRPLRELATIWTSCSSQPQPTVPVDKPTKQIDHVLYRPHLGWKVVETRVLEEAVASDHRALLAVLERESE